MAHTHGQGNPKWSRDETILALDLYLSCEGVVPPAKDPRVNALSDLLRSLPYHSTALRLDSFRNADGVAFKLQNIHFVATGKGLDSVSRMDRAVWEEFGSNPNRTQQAARLIREGVIHAKAKGEDPETFEDEIFPEGRIVTETHKKRERHPKLRAKVLAARKKTDGLKCEMCERVSISKDPAFEDAIFEVHHLVPISESEATGTSLKDVVLLCASCHRIIHRAIARRKQWLTLIEAKAVIGL